MPQPFYSSGGTPWDTVRSPHGDPWATVRNLAEKISRRPNGDQWISVRSSGDSSRMIERRSTDDYKGKLAGRWPADSRAFTCRSPQDHPAVSTDDRSQEPEQDDRGHESSSSSRKETPTKIPVLNCPIPLWKPKKRRETDKEEKSSSFNQIMEVMNCLQVIWWAAQGQQ